MASRPKRNFLAGLTIDEISLVDEPGNPHAKVRLMKSLVSAIPGASGVRVALAQAHGDAAVASFDAALADVSPDIADIIAKENHELDGTLSRAVHALGESLGEIYATGADGRDLHPFIEASSGEFGDVVKAAKASMDEGGSGDSIPCDNCPNEGKCDAAGKCMQAGKSGAGMGGKGMMSKSADRKDDPFEISKAIAEGTDAIAKAAATFNDLNDDREEREVLNRMTWALQDSISSILSDPEVADRAAMIRKSVGEFQTAVDQLLADDATEDTTTTAKGKPMTEKTPAPAESEVIKGLRTEMDGLKTKLASYEAAEAERVAKAKAMALLPAGGPVEQLTEFFKSASAENAKMMETIIASYQTQAREGGADIFKALGVPNPHDGNQAPEESPIVKAAKKAAAEDEKRRTRRAA